MNASGTLDPLAAPRRRPRRRRRARAARDQDRHAAAARGQRGAARAPRRRAACSTRSACRIPVSTRSPRAVLPEVRALGRPLVVSIGGFEHGDYELACRRLDDEPGIAALELQRLLPERQERLHLDRQRPRRDRGRSCASAAPPRVCRCGSSSRPTWPTSPRSRSPPSAAEPTRSCSRIPCARSRSTARPTGRCSAASRGGLSGPALKPVALAAVYTCREACALPIVGVGGIASGGDALEFLAAGRCSRPGRQRRLPRAAARAARARGACGTAGGAGRGADSALKTTTLD